MRIKIDRWKIKITYKTSLKCSFYKSNGLIKEKNANLCQRHVSVHGYLDLVYVQVLKETITRFTVSAHYRPAQWRSEEISLKSFFFVNCVRLEICRRLPLTSSRLLVRTLSAGVCIPQTSQSVTHSFLHLLC